ncbi:MAG: TrmH family RNA methyltransferase [Candidatus Promineifilaceae bacterium]
MKPLVGVELKRFLRDYRRAHPPRRELAFLLHSVEYPYNVGAIFRLADGAGVSQIVLSGITPTPPNPTIEKVGRFKWRAVPWRYEKDALIAARRLQAEGFELIALELAEGARPYFIYPYAQKCCLIVGHEDHGVTKALLAAADAAVFVPMYGKGRSHNVAAALAIVAYYALHAP